MIAVKAGAFASVRIPKRRSWTMDSKNSDAACVAAILFDLREPAEVEAHLALRCVPAHAAAHVFLDLPFLMEMELIIEFFLDS